MSCRNCKHCEEADPERKLIYCEFPLPFFVTFSRHVDPDEAFITCRTYEAREE